MVTLRLRVQVKAEMTPSGNDLGLNHFCQTR